MKLITTSLAACIVASFVGTAYVLALDRHAALWIAGAALVVAAWSCSSLGERSWTFALLWATTTLLGNGVYALHLLGIPPVALVGIAGALAALLVLAIGSAMIRSGRADPYDD